METHLKPRDTCSSLSPSISQLQTYVELFVWLLIRTFPATLTSKHWVPTGAQPARLCVLLRVLPSADPEANGLYDLLLALISAHRLSYV